MREHGCRVVGGTKHEKWRGPTDRASVLPRHNEIAWPLARKVCRDLKIPPPHRLALRRSRPLVQRPFCLPPRGLSSALMLADLERARHPASSLSRPGRRGRDRCGGSGSRRGLHAARRALRRGSECRKSLHTPGLSCVRARGRGRQNIFEQINNTTGTVLYLHHDQQGSTRLLTGSTGAKEASFTYDAYGNQTGHTGTATTPLGYDGQYTSSDTGLIYLRARTYDPATAQFLSVDPLEMVTRAPYTYGEDNPLNRDDATGLSSWNPFSESFWTEGNFISESPLNPIPYYEREISSYENGCGYFASVAHGLEGAVAGTALFAGGEGADEADIAVSDVLEGKLGSITRAPLPPGSPAWADIQGMSIADIRAAAKANEPGFKTILKLLTDNRFNKP